MMSDLTAALLPLLGVGGVTGFAALLARAFFGALKATAEVGEEKNRTIERQQTTILRQDAEIEQRETQNLQLRREVAARDIEIADLRAQLARMRGTAS
jgi:septal ring factor EnvC (AmiA/AmiB activator)